jgi:hypothetical protein
MYSRVEHPINQSRVPIHQSGLATKASSWESRAGISLAGAANGRKPVNLCWTAARAGLKYFTTPYNYITHFHMFFSGSSLVL